MNDETSHGNQLDLREVFGVLRRRRWMALAPFGIATLAGLVLALSLPPVYVSTVTLLFEKPQALPGNLGGVGGGATDPGSQADVMREQVKSSLFLNSVIAATGLKNEPKTRAWALFQKHRRRLATLVLALFVAVIAVQVGSAIPRETQVDVPLGGAHAEVTEARIEYWQEDELVRSITRRFSHGAPMSVRDSELCHSTVGLCARRA